MAKTEELDKDSKNRLKKLEEEWGKVGSSFDKFTAFDLRLLLENFQPLQELVRAIVAAELQAALAIQSDGAAATVPPMAEPPPEDSEALKNARQDLDQLKKRKADQTQKDLTECNTKAAELFKEKDSYKQEIKDLKAKCKQLQSQLQQTQADLADAQAHSSAEPTLAFLRSDPQLAQTTDLADLPADNTQALIQTVAVLAQIDNLKRLWGTLKDRCETRKRAVTDKEHALLQAALAWHNHNWRSLPLRLIDVAAASRYDYETQLRSRHLTKGETVAAMYLPGIADGSGKTLCKALVQTQ